jgi:hypothetical protein
MLNPDTHNYSQLKSCTWTNFWLRPILNRDTAPVPFLKFIYRDYFSVVYQTCTATAPAPNKTSTLMAKSTPYLSCHRDNSLPKVSGPVAEWLRQVTQPPFIAGPLVVINRILENRQAIK